MKSLQCATLDGTRAHIVDIETTFLNALPAISIVGLPSQSIQESKDRAKSALSSIGYKFPAQKVTINLSPSDIKKEGTHFDLGVALSICLQKEMVNFSEFFIFGELGLGGELKSTSTLFPLLLLLANLKPNTKVLVPLCIAQKASMIPNILVYGVKDLAEAVEFFKNPATQESFFIQSAHTITSNSTLICGQRYILNSNFELDFLDVKGQHRSKRASLISASGMHNILFMGDPGCGKSMSAKRLRYILPPLSIEEILQNASNQNLNGEEGEFEALRPMRSPHHTSSKPSIFGGGSSGAKIGEVALAHKGILFFDEFPHFNKMVLESLREPLEDHKILISRVNSKINYETKFLFVAALNPCPCGNASTCRCSQIEIKRYLQHISEPLHDRIDLHVQMEKGDDSIGLSSRQMYEQVLEAFKMQKQRGQSELNGKLSDKQIVEFCSLAQSSKNLLQMASKKYQLSHRGINKVLKIARTIADLNSLEDIKDEHIFEALSFRRVV